ncbi:helix-turn-helix domain-containing protein [Umezawaea beigongshangensis]|uniref:helix-turn-helix domain-containing protein n=1 Tax=Umezawaea beigongshangensis TaxID=2780383 RepID=UPI0018F1F766|nr:helix-turn-helix transcriptional regulator [Umezawaea beigongshangensis]
MRDSTAFGRELGDELRRLRVGMAGLDAARMAEQVGWDLSKLSMVEQGRHRASELDLLVFLSRCGLSHCEIDRFVSRYRHACAPYLHQAGCEQLPADLRALVLAETGAAVITSFDAVAVPCLLQTPEYSEALISGLGLTGRTEVAPAVRALTERQAIMRTHLGPECTFFVHENVLRLRVGDDRIMEDQILRLVFHAASPRCAVRVVPSSRGAVGAFAASCSLMQYEQETPVACVKSDLVRTLTSDAKVIARCRLVFERLDEFALDDEGSRNLLIDWVGEYDKPC